MDFWKAIGWQWRFTWCGVGSRNDLPEEWEPLLRWVGQCLAMLGGVLCTGDAPGSDSVFLEGYEKGKAITMPPAQIYFTKLKNMKNLKQDHLKGHHEAEWYGTFEEAKAMAFRARGTFEGLFPSGIALHTRNAFQVLSEGLDKPRWITIFWAVPTTKKKPAKAWKGGTNTAVQLSIMNHIPIVNLWDEEQRTACIEWIKAQMTKEGKEIPPLELPIAA